MNQNKALKVFVQENDLSQREKISYELKENNYDIYFFTKDEAVVDLLNLNPDIIIQDYLTNKMINLREWSLPI